MTESSDYQDDRLTEKIIECVIKVHKTLGPGFLESIYQNSLIIELNSHGFSVETEKEVPINYEGHFVGKHRLDLIVNGELILELKTVEDLSRAHYAQVRSYLKATELKKAILINFSREKADFRRIELS